MHTHSKEKPHVVIVGAGFAGLKAAKSLRGKPVNVTVIDQHNYHLFQPLLYQVATAGLEPGDVAHTVRDIFQKAENVQFRKGRVLEIDRAEKRIRLEPGPPVEYDYLILAVGTVTNFFGIDGASEHAFCVKKLTDAIRLRNHVIEIFEHLDTLPRDVPEGMLNFVIVGGGPTGVEMAGALVELFEVMQKDYKQIDTGEAQVYLLEMLPDLLVNYSEELQKYTKRKLEQRGVNVLTDTTVAAVNAFEVVLEDNPPIPTKTFIWAAGFVGHPLADSLNTEREKGGRVSVREDLRLLDDDHVFVVGDLAAAKTDDGMYPQLAPVAIQQGEHAGRQILRLIENSSTKGFKYNDRGKMATIGRHAAVAELPNGFKIKGAFAWFTWLVIHIMQLIGFKNRLAVFASWIYNYVNYDRSARLLLDNAPEMEQKV